MLKAQKQTTPEIENVDSMTNVRELLERQKEIARQLDEIENEIEKASEMETIENAVSEVMAGREPTHTLDELQRKRAVLRTALVGMDGKLRLARTLAGSEIIKAQKQAIDAVKERTSTAAQALKAAIIKERIFEQQLRVAGAFTDDLFPKPFGWFSLLPVGSEDANDTLINRIINR